MSFLTISGVAQTEEHNLTGSQVKEIVSELANQTTDNYIYADKGKLLSEHILRKLEGMQYPLVASELAIVLQKDARNLINDKHFRVEYRPKDWIRPPSAWSDSDYARQINYGFNEVKILPGNVGYLKLDIFLQPSFKKTREVAESAMSFLNRSDAIIIDLRDNEGGNPSMNEFIATYFFDEQVSLSGIYYRDIDELRESKTLRSVPGERMPNIPLYVLTSFNTFSSAEAFAFDMQVSKRATLVGEVTGGGAHPGRSILLPYNFFVWMPTGRTVNPNATGNWEGVGVKPHILVNEIEAYDRAYLEALNVLYDRAKPSVRKERLYKIIQELK